MPLWIVLGDFNSHAAFSSSYGPRILELPWLHWASLKLWWSQLMKEVTRGTSLPWALEGQSCLGVGDAAWTMGWPLSIQGKGKEGSQLKWFIHTSAWILLDSTEAAMTNLLLCLGPLQVYPTRHVMCLLWSGTQFVEVKEVPTLLAFCHPCKTELSRKAFYTGKRTTSLEMGPGKFTVFLLM